MALAITTPLGVVIHTGDFKVDPTPTDNELFDLHTLADYGKRGVLLLLVRFHQRGPPRLYRERTRRAARASKTFSTAPRSASSSPVSARSVHRLQQILDLAAEYGRKVAFLGRSMITVTEIAHDLGLLHIPDDILLRPQDIMSAPAREVAVVVSGTQGEPMSALSRVAVDNHKNLSVKPGDTVVLSSRIIPGNEKADLPDDQSHVAARRRDDLRHDESAGARLRARQRRRAETGAEPGAAALFRAHPRRVPAAGQARRAGLAPAQRRVSKIPSCSRPARRLRSTSRGARKGERVTVGRVCIDSGSLDEVVEDMVIRDRRHLSEDGFVLPIIAINKHTGQERRAAGDRQPRVRRRGIRRLLQEARQVVARTLESSPPKSAPIGES